MTIQINDLRAKGASLFADAESYMDEFSDGNFMSDLSDIQIGQLYGGWSAWFTIRISITPNHYFDDTLA